LAKLELEQHRIEPSSVLVANRPENANRSEAELLVQSNRPFVLAVADHRDHLRKATRFACRDQRLQ
jgi:hypothetical protein